MKTLIVDDDFISRRVLLDILSSYGDCDIAIDGDEAVQAVRLSWEERKPYDLICMDIIMPKMDGLEALKKIRKLEESLGVKSRRQAKVIMLTAVDDPKTIIDSYFKVGASSYLLKPINSEKIHEEVHRLELIR